MGLRASGGRANAGNPRIGTGAPQAPVRVTWQGQVVNQVTGEPVRRVNLTLRPELGGTNLRAVTDHEGKFTIAEAHEATAAQLAIAWVASRGEDIIPLIGTKRRDRLAEALKALDLTLSADDLAAVEAAVPAGAVAGDRYAPAQMATLDGER